MKVIAQSTNKQMLHPPHLPISYQHLYSHKITYKNLGRQAPRCRFTLAQQSAPPHLRRSPISLISVLSLGSRRFYAFFVNACSLPMAPSESVVVEYAKSSRSACKKCSEAIQSKTLRLGLVSRDKSRGFDVTKWHHLSCFPLPSFHSPPNTITGFSSLKSDDQEALTKLFAEQDKSEEECKATKDIQNEEKDTEKSDSKKRKAPMAPSESVVVEYAKSNRSACKKCSETIQSKTLRLGLASRDNRGFDVTKWHHLSCFPLPSFHYPPNTITGFSSLKSDDQEALTKLFAGQDKSEEECKATKDIQNEEKDTEESGSKKRKLSTSDVKVGANIIFSASDVKSTYKDAALLPKWKAFQTVIFLERDDGLEDSSKIAAFDFDGCLAKTSVKNVGPNAWSLMYSSIPDKLQSLYNNGYKLVIFTNESNIERWKKSRQKAVDSKIGRLNQFIEKVKVPIQVFIACGVSGKAGTKEDDPFRKPKPGMWQLMEKHFNSGITIDMDQSFYVGDAAGRESDHSDSDIRFAEANGLKFYVPEEYFAA